MNATFNLLNLAQNLMRTNVSNKNRVTHGATSATFSPREKFCDKAMLFLSFSSLMNNTYKFQMV